MWLSYVPYQLHGPVRLPHERQCKIARNGFFGASTRQFPSLGLLSEGYVLMVWEIFGRCSSYPEFWRLGASQIGQIQGAQREVRNNLEWKHRRDSMSSRREDDIELVHLVVRIRALYLPRHTQSRSRVRIEWPSECLCKLHCRFPDNSEGMSSHNDCSAVSPLPSFLLISIAS